MPFSDPINATLRKEVATEVASWDPSLTPEFVQALTDTGCAIAQYAYHRLTYEQQYIVSLYTVCITYMDDIAEHDLQAIGQFVQRLARGEPQENPVLGRMAALLGMMHEHYPRISADLIITSTTDAVTGMYIECITKGAAVALGAVKYPHYLRLKTGITAGYAHFNFPTCEGTDCEDAYYLQLQP